MVGKRMNVGVGSTTPEVGLALTVGVTVAVTVSVGEGSVLGVTVGGPTIWVAVAKSVGVAKGVNVIVGVGVNVGVPGVSVAVGVMVGVGVAVTWTTVELSSGVRTTIGPVAIRVPRGVGLGRPSCTGLLGATVMSHAATTSAVTDKMKNARPIHPTPWFPATTGKLGFIIRQKYNTRN